MVSIAKDAGDIDSCGPTDACLLASPGARRERGRMSDLHEDNGPVNSQFC